jgi:uncharacterized phage-associated protein
MHKEWLRFKLDVNKCIEGIQMLAIAKPGITQYYIGKIFFFADRAHLLDWGRPISGDRYVAMEHGPVPSTIRDLLKASDDEPDEVVDSLIKKVQLVQDGNRIHVFSKENILYRRYLSVTDVDYLNSSLKEYGDKSFGEIRKESHRDEAYECAWSLPGLNNEMDLRKWFNEEQLAEIFESPYVIKKAVSARRQDVRT